MNETRIKASDTIKEMVIKLAEGNPGALTILCRILDETPKIDPQNIMGGIGNLLTIDSCGIYGSLVWILYKDICNEDLVKTIACLRSYQLGFITNNQLINAINRDKSILDVDDLVKQVKAQLPEFNKVR